MFLGGFWEGPGRVLGEFWECLGSVLGGFWEGSGRVLAVLGGPRVGWRGQGIENDEKPMVFDGVSSEMLKNHWFLGGVPKGTGWRGTEQKL